MLQIIIGVLLGSHAVVSWLAPERCSQNSIKVKRYDNYIMETDSIQTKEITINNTVIEQHQNLLNKYKDIKVYGVPIRGDARSRTYSVYEFKIFIPNNCEFYTHNASLLSSVFCKSGIECELTYTVQTSDSYTSSEGYNWGAKISTKADFKILEIGGEASKGGEYSCTYTKTKTTSKGVRCAHTSDMDQTLQLYQIKSDMKCQFSEVTMKRDLRNNDNEAGSSYGDFDKTDIASIKAMQTPWGGVDMDKISDALLFKLKTIFPYFDPYRDLLSATEITDNHCYVHVYYFYQSSVTRGYQKLIPFTNEDGNSVFQHSCVY